MMVVYYSYFINSTRTVRHGQTGSGQHSKYVLKSTSVMNKVFGVQLGWCSVLKLSQVRSCSGTGACKKLVQIVLFLSAWNFLDHVDQLQVVNGNNTLTGSDSFCETLNRWVVSKSKRPLTCIYTQHWAQWATVTQNNKIGLLLISNSN